MGAPYDVLEGDVVMQDAYGSAFGTGFSDISSIMTKLQNMQLRKDERYVEDCRRRDVSEASQMERFCLMQEYMTTQDANFDAFASYVTESLVSMRNEMDMNPDAMIARINHMTSAQNDNHHHYDRFYREMCDFLDHHYGNDGHGWYRVVRPMPRGRGKR